MKKQILLPMKKAKIYLRKASLYQDPSEDRCKKVFLKSLSHYFGGEISGRLLSAIGLEILYNILSLDPGVIRDRSFRSVLEFAEDLEYLRSKNPKLTAAEDELKNYLKKNKYLLKNTRDFKT